MLILVSCGLVLGACCREYEGYQHRCSCRYQGEDVKVDTYCVEGDAAEFAEHLARDCTPQSNELNPCDSCSCGPRMDPCTGEFCSRTSLTEIGPDAQVSLEPVSRELVCRR